MLSSTAVYRGCFKLPLISFIVVEPGSPGYRRVKEAFGDDICHSDGHLNREKLGSIIFSNSEKRKLLNSILHPLIRRRILWMTLLNYLKGLYPALQELTLFIC